MTRLLAMTADDSPSAVGARGPVPHWLPLALLLAGVTAFQLLTVRAGHVWGDDFALYILHARAILEGRSYGDTGFIFHPGNPWYSPRVYPPGLPLILLPVYALLGVDLFVMKLVVAAFFSATVVVFALLVRRHLPPVAVLIAAGLLGFQPYLMQFKDHILPDLPFLFFVVLGLYLISRIDEEDWSLRQGIGLGLAAGAAVYLAIATRTIGITLFGAIGLLAAVRLLQGRRPRPGVYACLAVAAVGYFVQAALMPPASGYAQQVSDVTALHGTEIVVPGLWKARRLAEGTLHLLDGPPQHFRNAVGLLVLLLAAVGSILRLRRPGIVEAFAISYAAAIFLYPATGLRYSVPLIPFVIFYAVVGGWKISRRLGRPAYVGASVLGLAVAGAYLLQLSTVDRGPIRGGADGDSARGVYEWIVACTRPDDRVLFRKPRAVTLFTGRPALVTPTRPFDTADLNVLVRSAGVRVAIASNQVFSHPDTAMMQLPGFRPAYANEDFTVLAADLESAPPGCASPGVGPAPGSADPEP